MAIRWRLVQQMNSGAGSLGSTRLVDTRLTIRDRRAVTAYYEPETGDDASLVNAARAGDRAAFGALYARHAKMVHGILLARVPATEVDDLVQDVFLRALPHLRGLRDVTRFGPWLAAITRNRANDYHRRSRSQAVVTESLSEDESEVSALGAAPDVEAQMILTCVRSLPEAYSETLILRLVEGMTGPEIASRTGMTPGSVRVNLHRGMQQLREKLSETSRSGATQSASSAETKYTAARNRNALRRRKEP